MTVVVAVDWDDGAVVVGCDSSIVRDDARETVDTPKWWIHHGVLVAFAGDLHAARIAREAHHRQRAPGVDVLAYVERLNARTRAALRRERIAMDSLDLLVAVRGRAYVIASNAVTRSEYGYAAIGSGEEYALGSLASTERQAPTWRVEQAIAAAARHSSTCSPPSRVLVHR